MACSVVEQSQYAYIVCDDGLWVCVRHQWLRKIFTYTISLTMPRSIRSVFYSHSSKMLHVEIFLPKPILQISHLPDKSPQCIRSLKIVTNWAPLFLSTVYPVSVMFHRSSFLIMPPSTPENFWCLVLIENIRFLFFLKCLSYS